MAPSSITQVLGRGQLVLQKYSPEILTGVGLLSMGAGAFLAVKQTLKLEVTVEAAEERIKAVKALETTDKQAQLRKAYLKNVLEFTKLYGPSISLFVSGAGAILAGHGIMRKRNVALVAAYNAIEKSFQAYRARVIEDLGLEKDRDYLLGINETFEQGKDGKKESVVTVDPTKASRYVRIFDETNPEWQAAPGFNQFFLTAKQNWFNDKLHATGHVFLNDVYRVLGFEDTEEGAVVGWVLDNEDPEADHYIDFGIYDAASQQKRHFVNGYENSIWLDFNVDGYILDKIGKRRRG
jgi:hypothetical protein